MASQAWRPFMAGSPSPSPPCTLWPSLETAWSSWLWGGPPACTSPCTTSCPCWPSPTWASPCPQCPPRWLCSGLTIGSSASMPVWSNYSFSTPSLWWSPRCSWPCPLIALWPSPTPGAMPLSSQTVSSPGLGWPLWLVLPCLSSQCLSCLNVWTSALIRPFCPIHSASILTWWEEPVLTSP